MLHIHRLVLNRFFRGVITVVFVMVVSILLSKFTYAEIGDINWSWTDTPPKVFSSALINGVNSSLCKIPYRLEDIDGAKGKKNVCVTSGDRISFGAVSPSENMGAAYTVSFAYDKKMYKFFGPCAWYNNCTYLPATDTLVTRQKLINNIVLSLVVYKNFSKRLIKTDNYNETDYYFNSENPDYIFKNADNYAWPVGGVDASENGKWLAIEFRQRGIGILDIETLKMKRISTMSFGYGFGSDPASELAVTNDGMHVAVMGMNAGLSVFDVNKYCGDEAKDENMVNVAPIDQPCKKAQIDTNEFINRFFGAITPKFNDNGGELNFYAMSFVGEAREVTLRAAGFSGQGLDYLAIGDSFSSGEGETNDKYYQKFTNNKFEKCHTSTRSYPYLVAGLLKINPVFAKSVACSGAVTGDVIGDDYSYIGQNKRLGEGGMKLSSGDVTLAKTEAKYSFIPGRIHQETFVKEYKPKIITVGVGGNDAGLIGKLQTCLSPGTCNWASDNKMREQTAVEIKNVFDKLVKTYQKLHDDSPFSKIYAIGYPKIIDSNRGCGVFLNRLLDDTEKEFINESVIYLNRVVEAAAKSAGVGYIDVQNSFGDQVLCGSQSPSAMNEVRTGDDINLINNQNWTKFLGQESFHPNPLGHELVAGYVANLIIGVNSEYCADGSTLCRDQTITAPTPSSYWIPDGEHNYPALMVSDFVSDCDEPSCSLSEKQLSLDPYSLSPGSDVTVEINSTPQILGSYLASEDGGMDIKINLPVNLEEGYHTVHLYGTSYSGESVDLYQVIKYMEKDTSSDIQSNIINDNLTKPSVDLHVVASSSHKPDTKIIQNKKINIASTLGNPEIKGESDKTNNKQPNEYKKSYIPATKTILTARIFIIVAFIASVIFYCVRKAVKN